MLKIAKSNMTQDFDGVDEHLNITVPTNGRGTPDLNPVFIAACTIIAELVHGISTITGEEPASIIDSLLEPASEGAAMEHTIAEFRATVDRLDAGGDALL